jgi:hypothetical protein
VPDQDEDRDGLAHGGAVTPPRDEPARRPGVVTAAVVLWVVLGALLVLTAVLFGVALVVPGAADPGTGTGSIALSTLLLLAAGVGALLGARWLLPGSPRARTGLTALGAVLAVIGLVQVTFTGVGGSWFVAFVVAVVLLHLPAARPWFRESR